MAHFRNHQKVQGVLVKKLMTGQQNREKNNKQQQQPPDVLCKKRCFPANFAKFVRTPFLQNTSGRLLLKHGMERSYP